MDKKMKNSNPYIIASILLILVTIGIMIGILCMEEPVEESTVTETVVIMEEEKLVSELAANTEERTTADTKDSDTHVSKDVGVSEEISGGSKETVEMDTEEISGQKEDDTIETYEEESMEPEVILESEQEQSEQIELQEELAETTSEPEEAVETLPHEHSWLFESNYQEPTCSNGGLINEVCVHCGETRIVGGSPTGKHDFIVEIKGDCCSEEVVRCSVCNTREMRGNDMTNHIDAEGGICYGCGQKISGE